MKHWKILALLAVALLLLPLAALADGATVTVSGTGMVAFRPDTALITLGVSESAKGAVDAQSIVNGKIDAIKKALAALGVADKDFAVGSVSLWESSDRKLLSSAINYTASHTLTITTADMDAVRPLIDAALAAGANQLQGINFLVKRSSEAYDKALTLAVEKARAKAEVLAAAAGVKLGA